MKRIRSLAIACAVLVSSILLGAPALAGPQWCEEDPVFAVNGAIVDVTTSFPARDAESVSRAHFDLQVPSNAVAAVVALPAAVPTTASISPTLERYSGIGQLPVVLTVTLYTDRKFETYTRIAGTYGPLVSGVWGTSTKPTRLKLSLYGIGL